uniref:Uncharacterized protein n=1 Tax=Glossina brevipalpis TaxID=37001 RepID=A0A1A9WPD3_9MUSC
MNKNLNVQRVGAPEYGIGAPKYGIGAPEYGIGAPKYGIGAPKYGIRAPKYGIGAPKYGIRAPKYGIGGYILSADRVTRSRLRRLGERERDREQHQCKLILTQIKYYICLIAARLFAIFASCNPFNLSKDVDATTPDITI